MRYNIATLAELRTFRPLRLHPRPRRRAAPPGRDAGRDRQRAVVRRGLRITEGALLDDGLLDVVIIKPMSKAGLVRTYPKLFKGTHVTHPQYEHHRVRSVTVAAPGIVAYADGERFGALPAHRRVRARSAERPRP